MRRALAVWVVIVVTGFLISERTYISAATGRPVAVCVYDVTPYGTVQVTLRAEFCPYYRQVEID